MLPVSTFAQGAIVAADIDTYLALLNAECPIEYHEAWAINSIVTVGDTVDVAFQTPSSLAGFLSMITGDNDKVKRMWIKQLKSFGHPWGDLIDRLTDAGRPLSITFCPANSRNTAVVFFSPEELATLANPEKPSPLTPQDCPVGDDETQQAE